ncbi:MAG TPA: hypothetical protein VGE76_12385 [Opitutaceae bacterium]
MNTLPPSDPEWERTLRLARGDTPPPVDTAALLRVVRAESSATRVGWFDELAGLFALPRLILACGAAVVALGWFAASEVSEAQDALAWARLVEPSLGGDL